MLDNIIKRQLPFDFYGMAAAASRILTNTFLSVYVNIYSCTIVGTRVRAVHFSSTSAISGCPTNGAKSLSPKILYQWIDSTKRCRKKEWILFPPTGSNAVFLIIVLITLGRIAVSFGGAIHIRFQPAGANINMVRRWCDAARKELVRVSSRQSKWGKERILLTNDLAIYGIASGEGNITGGRASTASTPNIRFSMNLLASQF